MPEKFVQPANKNFTTFYEKHVYESWRIEENESFWERLGPTFDSDFPKN